MALHVTLVEDTIRKDGTLVPRIVEREKVAFETILEFMTNNTALRIQDMRAAFERFAEALRFYLRDGKRAYTPLGTFALGIHRSKHANGTRESHLENEGIHILFNPEPDLLDALQKSCDIELEESAGPKLPFIDYAVNLENREAPVNSAAAGEMIGLRGSRLKFDHEDPEQGVFFVTAEGEAARCEVVTREGSRLVDCKVPTLAAGEYRLQVRTRPTDRDVRTGVMQKAFSVHA